MKHTPQPSHDRIVVRGGLGSPFASAFDEFEPQSTETQSWRETGGQNTMREQSAALTTLGPSGGQGTESGQQAAPSFETALARNRAFAAAGGHQGATVFPALRLLAITCLDPRVDPAHFLGLDLSDAVVVRNGGGRVTPGVINDVALVCQLAENAVPDGPLFEVAVIHHTQCKTAALADDDFLRRYAQRVGADESSLREYAILDPAATVESDVDRLRSAEAISPRLTFSGHVYDVVTGLVETVIPALNSAATSRRSA